MNFRTISTAFEKIESTSSRLIITELLADIFKKVSPEELQYTTYLLQGRVVPLYEKLEFGMAERSVVKSIVKAFGLDTQTFTRKLMQAGDMGKAVEQSRMETLTLDMTEHELTISDVYQSLREITESGGEGSQDKKSTLLGTLLRSLDPLSCRYIVRIVLSTLRMGFSDMTILDAFSWMIQGDKSLRPVLLKAYQMRPDLGFIGRLLKEKGIETVEKVKPVVFTPILMMRAERLSSAEDILKQIGPCAVEPKYDGFRVQIHYSPQNGVKIFSRNLEEVSPMFPDIVVGMSKSARKHECIVEGEAVGYNPKTGKLVPFQETVQRKRKYEIESKAKELPLRVFIFELLYLDGKSYIDEPFEARRKILTDIFPANNIAQDVRAIDQDIIDNASRLDTLFDQALAEGKEGIIAKKMQGPYQPGARGWNWIKFKRSYSSKINDTIDCLVMGYDAGKGKRTNFGIGAFLVGVYDEKSEKYVTVAKIGTGLSDEEWKELFMQCQKIKIRNQPSEYDTDKQMIVDQWVEPHLVMEIRADEITRSPVHTAGRKMGQSKSGQAQIVEIPGYALRFPRLERFRRDKGPTDITTVKELQQLEKLQLHSK